MCSGADVTFTLEFPRPTTKAPINDLAAEVDFDAGNFIGFPTHYRELSQRNKNELKMESQLTLDNTRRDEVRARKTRKKIVQSRFVRRVHDTDLSA